MSCLKGIPLGPEFKKVSQHPCFSGEANMTKGRIHLPVSPVCNIRCNFCKRSLNKTEQRPGVTAKLLEPQEASDLIEKALELCPHITVAGIAGPGDTLASPHALETFRLIHERYPNLINCLSTNGLLLERYANALWDAGVRTITVTVNAVYPTVLKDIVEGIVYDGKSYVGEEAAEILIEAQKRGIRKMADKGAVIKINIVLIPGINDHHIGDIARTVKEHGANIINIIPLIPQHRFSDIREPNCQDITLARAAAEEYLPVFRHCQHCRADACGIPGGEDVADLLYAYRDIASTFSHG
jgi:nitrogen fixation protein NifB